MHGQPHISATGVLISTPTPRALNDRMIIQVNTPFRRTGGKEGTDVCRRKPYVGMQSAAGRDMDLPYVVSQYGWAVIRFHTPKYVYEHVLTETISIQHIQEL